MKLTLREPTESDKSIFIKAMKESEKFHRPWIEAPSTEEAFDKFLARSRESNQKSFLLVDDKDSLLGVFNLNEIVRGAFQNAYLGFYAVSTYSGKGFMSEGLKLIMNYAFNELGLHRLEANIQPFNDASVHLVKENGFRKEGFSPHYLFVEGQWRDHERWAITAEDR